MKSKIITSAELLEMAGKVYDGVLLDMDGTILDSMGMWKEIDRIFLERRGFSLEEDYTRTIKTMTFPQSADYTVKRYGLDESPDAIMQEWFDLAIELYRTAIDLKPGVREVLRKWKEKKIPAVICSVSQKRLVEAAVRQYELQDLLTALVFMESTGKGKDEPDTFLYGASLLKLSPERCLVMEDSLQAMRTAHDAGFPVCAVYDVSAEKDQEAILQTADFYLPKFQN